MYVESRWWWFSIDDRINVVVERVEYFTVFFPLYEKKKIFPGGRVSVVKKKDNVV